MQDYEKGIGVLPDSMRFYCDADDFAAANLFFVPLAGIYHCDEHYIFSRVYLDVSQFILIDAGALTVECDGQVQTATAGTLVLLDCRRPSTYYAATPDLRMRWFHFAGSSSEAYTALLHETHGFLIDAAAYHAEIQKCCTDILQSMQQKQQNPHLLSVSVHQMLALLTATPKQKEVDAIEQSIMDAATYIDAHYGDASVSVPQLARRAALSECYFLRKFKQHLAMTPHQYVQSSRIRAAKASLTTTSDSVETIASSCGFCSTSHFVMAFRKATGMTPLQFRTMWKS